MSRSRPPVPQEELENFPLPSVRHSQTVLNQLRYPSVLLLVCQDADQSKPDVHFFHCDEVEVGGRPWARGEGARVPPQSRPDAPRPHPAPPASAPHAQSHPSPSSPSFWALAGPA